MEENILVRTLGDSHFLKVLGFFLEHPIHSFSVTTLSSYLELSRDTVKKDLEFFEDLGYVIRTSNRGPYKLRLSNDMVRTLIRCATVISQTYLKEEIIEPIEEIYLHPQKRRVPGSCRMVAGA